MYILCILTKSLCGLDNSLYYCYQIIYLITNQYKDVNRIVSRMSELHDKCVTTIADLIKLYEHSDYMLERINNHINKYLPNTLNNEFTNYEKRVNRNTYLTNEQQIFIQVFLSKNPYFYLPSTNFFYQYNSFNYLIVKEDDVIHNLLSSISKDRILLQWKHKTKLNVVKQIRERNLFSSIPETTTIQCVLNVLYPSIFSTKNAAKYFLTIIGDNIFKKNTNLIFLVSHHMKKLLSELDNVAVNSIGYNNTTWNFMTKYHENHSYEHCRLLKINETVSNEIWREMLKKIGLDLLCVSAHYSNRYENSDKFIENKSDEELKIYSYYLKNKNQINIVDEFCSKYIICTTSEYKMEWKNIHFVWKQFLSNSGLPNIIYSNTLKNLLKTLYEYDENIDSFLCITSKYMPIQIDFMKFWENTINIVNDGEPFFDNELEIDELCNLFKLWTKQTNEPLMTNGNISEENVLKIIKHFLPNIVILDEKYILNTVCSLWDKNNDIVNSFDYIKEQIKKSHNLALVSFDDAYNYYYKYCNISSIKFIVSKRYFEKCLYFKIPSFIVYEKFIDTKWVTDVSI